MKAGMTLLWSGLYTLFAWFLLYFFVPPFASIFKLTVLATVFVFSLIGWGSLVFRGKAGQPKLVFGLGFCIYLTPHFTTWLGLPFLISDPDPDYEILLITLIYSIVLYGLWISAAGGLFGLLLAVVFGRKKKKHRRAKETNG
ncbi:hypothetical protein J31TS4_16490 [Paenibacillus sp. J31TS4]|uniref:hypothetical protein n=1 Tax=Paenibacillus sp. J31TS4 TaxID=2807195 RepID=UPI001B1FEC8F|nr:hypothetical protein [Paenibacillus sp. J31TS4]GIP38369.1 hypothetical protein J31TS4_16490 [Paenibacillus sp. J31TS4]